MLESKSWAGNSSNIYALLALQTPTEEKVLSSLLFLPGIKRNQCSLTCQKTEIKQHNPKVQMLFESRHVTVSEGAIWKNCVPCDLWTTKPANQISPKTLP